MYKISSIVSVLTRCQFFNSRSCHSLLLKTNFVWTQNFSERTAYVSWQPVPGAFLWLPAFFWPKVSHILCLLLVYLRALLLHSSTISVCAVRHWILAALTLAFLPSLFKGFPTTYWQTLSSLARLKCLQILLTLLYPNHQGTVSTMWQSKNILLFF